MYCRDTGKRKLLAVSKFQPWLFAWLLISTLGALALSVVVKQNCLAGIAFQQTIYTSVNWPVQWFLFWWLIIISCFKEQLLRTFLCPAKQVTLMLKNLEPELHRKDKFLGWHSFQASKDLHTTHSLEINYIITNLFHKAELAEWKQKPNSFSLLNYSSSCGRGERDSTGPTVMVGSVTFWRWQISGVQHRCPAPKWAGAGRMLMRQ